MVLGYNNTAKEHGSYHVGSKVPGIEYQMAKKRL